MMMPPATHGVQTPGQLPSNFSQDGFFDDISNQVAISQAARRLSRSSNGQRAGSAMRVVKPNSASANNSPRSSMMAGRRRTMMGDHTLSRGPPMDYLSIPRGNASFQPRKQNARPVSWHPASSQMQPLQPCLLPNGVYQAPPSGVYMDHQDIYGGAMPQYSPMMASYSTNTSPCSTFSPLPPHGLSGLDVAQYGSTSDWGSFSQRQGNFDPVTPNDNPSLTEPFPALNGAVHDKIAQGNRDWNSFITHGFNNASPPSPEAYLPLPLPLAHPHPDTAEDTASQQALDESEEEGEILVGMGLYDTPDRHEDMQMLQFRSTVSSLLGSAIRPHEPKGKGLKLEETWEPPNTDEEEDDEDDGAEDDDGEDNE